MIVEEPYVNDQADTDFVHSIRLEKTKEQLNMTRMLARTGFPVVSDGKTEYPRYYKGITDEEFNKFFGE